MGHFFLVVCLVAVDRGLAGVFGLDFEAAGALRLAGARFVAGFFGSTERAAFAAGAGAASGSGAGAGSGVVAATPIVLDSVRWHVSQLTIVRTSWPSWCSSRRRLRVRWQKLQ